MKLIRRGNVELSVADDMLQHYLNQGYNEIDNKGNIINSGTPNNFTDLKRAYSELEKENTDLKEKVNVLTKQVESLNNELKARNKKITTKEKE